MSENVTDLALAPASRASWPSRRHPAAAVLFTVLLFAVAAHGRQLAGQQQSVAPPEVANPGDSEVANPADSGREIYRDPYQAYAAGAYDQALDGLVSAQVRRPEDPDLELNIGSTHYQMRNYEDAERAYLRSALDPDAIRRSAALYNLGNTAYRQGKLGDAIDRYMAALELNPEDQDAKFNLEFVREEMRRRQEQQQQQQEQQQGEQDSGEQNQQPQASDRDGDGLPDQVEREGRNPTDPENPDTDGDGRSDGEEDTNRNGQVDEGESDPNHPDTEDGENQDSEEESGAEESAQAQEEAPSSGRELTPEEAERFLQALEEQRPESPERKSAARGRRVEKDW